MTVREPEPRLALEARPARRPGGAGPRAPLARKSARQSESDRQVTAWRRYVLAVVAYGVVFSFWQAEPVPLRVHFAAIAAMAIAGIPLALWYQRGSRGAPMFELICISFAIQYSLPIYLETNLLQTVAVRNLQISWDADFECLLMVCLGLLALIAGYYGFLKSKYAPMLRELTLQIPNSRRDGYIIIALLIGGIFTTSTMLGIGPPNSSGIGAIIRVLADQLYIAIVILARIVFRDGDTWSRRAWLLYLATGAACVLGFASGFVENILTPIVLVGVVRWQATGRAPLRWIVVGFIAFGLLNSVKQEYRQQAWNSPGSVSLSQKIGLWGQLLGNQVSNLADGNIDYLQTTVRQSYNRFDQIHQFAVVHTATPSSIPYDNGGTYSYFVYGWIPRLVWPNKPIAQQANVTFEQRYGFANPDQVTTTMAGVGHITEAYMNFGVPGIAIVMLLEGIVFAMLGRILNGPTSDGGQAIYLVVMVVFLNGIGSNTAGLFGAIVQVTAANALLMVLLTGREWRILNRSRLLA